jgi:endonuclease YncB( thermonuclease family)
MRVMRNLSLKWLLLVAGVALSVLDVLSNAISVSDLVVRAFAGDERAEPGVTGTVLLDGNGMLSGVPTVVDTATLRVDGRDVRLLGVAGLEGEYAARMAAYIDGREVRCVLVGADRYRCDLDGKDLAQAVLFNGGGRAEVDATPELRDAERHARSRNRGIWAER